MGHPHSEPCLRLIIKGVSPRVGTLKPAERGLGFKGLAAESRRPRASLQCAVGSLRPPPESGQSPPLGEIPAGLLEEVPLEFVVTPFFQKHLLDLYAYVLS